MWKKGEKGNSNFTPKQNLKVRKFSDVESTENGSSFICSRRVDDDDIPTIVPQKLFAPDRKMEKIGKRQRKKKSGNENDEEIEFLL